MLLSGRRHRLLLWPGPPPVTARIGRRLQPVSLQAEPATSVVLLLPVGLPLVEVMVLLVQLLVIVLPLVVANRMGGVGALSDRRLLLAEPVQRRRHELEVGVAVLV